MESWKPCFLRAFTVLLLGATQLRLAPHPAAKLAIGEASSNFLSSLEERLKFRLTPLEGGSSSLPQRWPKVHLTGHDTRKVQKLHS